MADLGNLNDSLRLACKPCGWRPPGDMTMRDAQLHFQVEHDTDDVKFDLVAVCSCGAAMEHAFTKPAGGRLRDYVKCPACKNTGFLLRDAGEGMPRRG